MLEFVKKEGEKKLLDVLGKLKDSGGHYVVHLKFSELLEHYKNEYQHKIAVNIIQDILKDANGFIIEVGDYDIFVICRDVMTNVVRKMIFQLRYLYMDDPLCYDADGNENPAFAQIYELKINWRELFNIARDKSAEIQKQKDRENVKKRHSSDPTELTPDRLARVEAELGKINIADAFRSQPVCAAKASGFQTLFNELYINIAALGELTTGNINLTSNKALFRYLTEILDGKMLEYIRKNSTKYMRNAISINLNIESLLSGAFSEFDKNLEEKTKKNIVLELQIADVFSDIRGFLTARDLVQASGYRICLDGLNSLTITQIDRQLLGFDLAKMFWNADIKNDNKSSEGHKLKDAIERCGKSRIILARCDAADAVYYGQSLGVSLFQGRYVDSIVNPDSKIVN